MATWAKKGCTLPGYRLYSGEAAKKLLCLITNIKIRQLGAQRRLEENALPYVNIGYSRCTNDIHPRSSNINLEWTIAVWVLALLVNLGRTSQHMNRSLLHSRDLLFGPTWILPQIVKILPANEALQYVSVGLDWNIHCFWFRYLHFLFVVLVRIRAHLTSGLATSFLIVRASLQEESTTLPISQQQGKKKNIPSKVLRSYHIWRIF